ncbi:MAG: ankyrin repeat domain-containing protein [Candidatus Marsarchaeota archaeon]|nr:ankyrin repeat domain-containing protein [Candidatus Marsarchaeota archaeon]MCL5413554.1 ankyrin repeat domain-containing protein [Candidatus Marsarchaeota archaeon]
MKTTTRPTQASLNEDLINKATIGNLEGVKAAFRNGADLNASDRGLSAIDHAARIGHADIVRFFLDYGATISPKTIRMAQLSGSQEMEQLIKAMKEKQQGHVLEGAIRE